MLPVYKIVSREIKTLYITIHNCFSKKIEQETEIKTMSFTDIPAKSPDASLIDFVLLDS